MRSPRSWGSAVASDLQPIAPLPVLDDKALRRQLHSQLLSLVNTIDATSIAHADDYVGQARLAQVVDMLIRDLRLVRADIGQRCADHFPTYDKGKSAGKPMAKTLIDGIGEVRRSGSSSWKDPDWDAITTAIGTRAKFDPATGEVFDDAAATWRAIDMTLACTGRSSIRVGGVEALGLEISEVARRDEARPNVSVPSLGDWDI